jgi:uncharacterized membrane protein YhaH (DUF805 family)
MRYIWFVFSTKGRINRLSYCLSLSTLIVLLGISLLAVYANDHLSNPDLKLGFRLAFLSLVAVEMIGLFAMVPIGVKRLHDRNKSGLWLVLFYVLPALLVLHDEAGGSEWSWERTLILIALLGWSALELCCRRGTVGTNQYGPDPIRSPSPQSGSHSA